MVPIKTINRLEWLSQLNALYKREMPDTQSSLAAAANYHYRNPGKSFRAQLALSSGIALGLNETDNLHWAAACELLHNASLIHDDISDASTHRRGQESINQHFGSDMALCLGDWMVAKAFELAARNRNCGGQLAALLAQAMQETCSGQISDISQRQCAEIKEWQRIAKGKTAPLLIAPIKGAAIAAGLAENLNSLEHLVGLCGLAYQGRNDIDDIIPSSHRSSDLDGRKPNLVVSLFAQQGVGREDFNRWYRSDNNEQLVQWQRRIASSDVILQANQSVEYWLLQAEQLVKSVPQPLQSVTQQLVDSVKEKTIIKNQGRIA
ncbi:MAG: serralysin [Porticoccaceae bacterium]|jgi:geranylgeranyl pyrophosphate synthase|nr:serralysin [Porticoccaceae bacterium]MBT5578505.1 serralysin [Porticoccaceae bacterium]MBT7376285.1 serralysin [Porticoccaceae bacterium]